MLISLPNSSFQEKEPSQWNHLIEPSSLSHMIPEMLVASDHQQEKQEEALLIGLEDGNSNQTDLSRVL